MCSKPYNPLTDDEAQKKADRIAQEYCVGCPSDYPACKECIWYLIMNNIIGEEEF